MTPLQKKLRKAFSMVELIFVIVVLGIVSSIASEIVVKIYASYLTQRAVHNSSLKTELAATQLVNRLTYSIPGTIIGRLSAAVYDPIDTIPLGSTRTTLEWIGYDADGFGAAGTGTDARPVWSGYCDVNASSLNALSTPGSRLTDLSTIIGNLSGSTLANAAVFFPDTYTAMTVGFQGGTSNAGANLVAGNTGATTLNLDAGPTGRIIKEHYKLAWTAYAVVPVQLANDVKVARGFQASDTLWDLKLYYDYQPWEGENYLNGSSQTLLTNVSVFNFRGIGDTIRFKVCQRENVGGTYSINTCKEKAVIR